MGRMRILGVAAALASSALAVPATANDDLVRGILGVGSAIILNQAQQQEQQRRQSQNRRLQQQYQGQRRMQNYGASPRAAMQAGQGKQPGTQVQRAEIQRRLNALGFDAGEPDGFYGPRTRDAIARFQASLGRTPDGQLSNTEVAALYAATAGAGAGGGGMVNAFDAGEPSAFPQLGGPADASSGAGGFPSLGSADQAAKPGDGGGFPTLGAPSGATEKASSGGFPTLGAPSGEESGGGGGFPALSGPAAETGEAPAMPKLGKPAPDTASAFPSLSGPAAATGEAPAMPKLGKPAPETASAFPALSDKPAEGDEPAEMPALAPSVQEDTAFPETAQPRVSETPPQMPPLAGAPASSEDGTKVTLDGELAKTVYGDRKRQPSVLGVALGQEAAEAAGKLKEAGFAGCDKPDAAPLTCSRETETLKDAVTLWWNGEDGLWAIRRRIEFKAPAPADFIRKQFEAGYAEMLRSNERTVSSGRFCHLGGLPEQGLAALVDRMAGVARAAADEVPQDVAGFAKTCPLAYVANFQGEQVVSAVTLTFFDATGFVRRSAVADREREERARKERDKLSGDLKL